MAVLQRHGVRPVHTLVERRAGGLDQHDQRRAPIAGLSPQGPALNGIQYGYAGGNLTFGFSAGQFNVSAGYFATTSNQSTRYLYGCPYNASLQATVVDPGSTAAVSLDTATGDWTIDTSAPFLTLPAGYSMVAPTMGPSDSGDFTISMPSAATYYLLGNSSSSLDYPRCQPVPQRHEGGDLERLRLSDLHRER